MSQRAVAIATELGVLRELDALRLLSIETVRGRVITFIVELPGRACSPPKHGLALRCRITLDCVMAYRLLARPRWDPAAFNERISSDPELATSMSDPALQESSLRIDAYLQDVCGIGDQLSE